MHMNASPLSTTSLRQSFHVYMPHFVGKVKVIMVHTYVWMTEDSRRRLLVKEQSVGHTKSKLFLDKGPCWPQFLVSSPII